MLFVDHLEGGIDLTVLACYFFLQVVQSL